MEHGVSPWTPRCTVNQDARTPDTWDPTPETGGHRPTGESGGAHVPWPVPIPGAARLNVPTGHGTMNAPGIAHHRHTHACDYGRSGVSLREIYI